MTLSPVKPFSKAFAGEWNAVLPLHDHMFSCPCRSEMWVFWKCFITTFVSIELILLGASVKFASNHQSWFVCAVYCHFKKAMMALKGLDLEVWQQTEKKQTMTDDLTQISQMPQAKSTQSIQRLWQSTFKTLTFPNGTDMKTCGHEGVDRMRSSILTQITVSTLYFNAIAAMTTSKDAK